MKPPYDPNDKASVIEHARKLKGKTLREACTAEIGAHAISGKGIFGHMLEQYYFGYEPNSKSQADFVEAGIELKSAPLKQLKNKEYRSKERLVLGIIDYGKIVGEGFEESAFWKKNAHLLIVFYLHEKDAHVLDLPIKWVDTWEFPRTDLEVIKKDWAFIKEKIAAGKAHELSEGDTFYLGACTKGANAGTVRSQPFSPVPAKQRAYSLKQGYVNHIVASITGASGEVYGKLIPSLGDAQKRTLEDMVLSRFEPYYGLTEDQILSSTGLCLNKTAKGFYAAITKAILGIGPDQEIEEFDKADIIVRTVRLKENDLPKEDISFPNFEYETIVRETWEDSAFKNILERKFFFVFFRFRNGQWALQRARFWNMPQADIVAVEEVWARTKDIVSQGEIVKEVKNGVRYTRFPGKGFHPIAHVRPHARNAADTYPLPVPDRSTQAMAYTKHCFWLNNSYVRDEIYLK